MTTIQADSTPFDPIASEIPAKVTVVQVRRRTVDVVLIGMGVVAVVVLATAAGLLTWGNRFASDYVGTELSSQHIAFPDAAALTAGGRGDLLAYAGRTVDTGSEAQAYASYIDGHLAEVADGATYADLGAVQSAARAAVTEATTAGQSPAEIAALQATVDTVTAERTTLFQGETLRGLLLSAYAWSTVGTIAGIAAIAAYVATAVLLVLVALGLVHWRREALGFDRAVTA
jgi:hypothetical protein